MTDNPKHHRADADGEVERWVATALAKSHELIPLTEAEVAEAEAMGVPLEGELPEGVKRYSPRARDKVVRLTPERMVARSRAWVGHAVAGLLGAAAMAALWVWHQPEGTPPLRLAREPLGPTEAGPVLPAAGRQVTIGPLPACGESCCAGTDCAAAKTGLKTCASRRRCIRCDEGAEDARYRIRIGRLAPSDEMRQLLDKSPDRSFELCVRVATSKLVCTPAHANTVEDESWASLPLVASRGDLLAGLTVQVRSVGEAEVVAEWAMPIECNPLVLCNGIAVRPKLSDGNAAGSLSLFLDDAYFVELGRSASASELLNAIRQLPLSGVSPQVYETDAPGKEHYAIGLGPFDKHAAEILRWSALEHGTNAKLVLGFDYRGASTRPPQP